MNLQRIFKLPAGVLPAVQNAATPLALMDNGAIVYFNTAFLQRFGKCAGKTAADFFTAENLDQLNWLLRGAHGESDKIVLHLKEELGGGDVMVQLWPIDSRYCLFSLRDDYSMERLADIDGLTQLPNRRKAMMLLEIEKARAHRSNDSAHYCLSLGDIDHFKRINDTYGHQAGDRVLRHVARLMTSMLREGDWVARWGGEEFMIFTPEHDVVTGIQPIERLRQAIANTPCAGDPDITVTMSFGLAAAAADRSIRDVIGKADALLYEAKSNGRNRTEWEEGAEAKWMADKICQTVTEGRLQLHWAPLTAWDGGAAAFLGVPFVRDLPYAETEKMLAAASRLHLQETLNAALLQRAAAVPSLPAPRVFLLQEKMLLQRQRQTLSLMSEHGLCAGIDAEAPLSRSALQKLAASDTPLALLNFRAGSAPSYLLAADNLRLMVFADTRDAAKIIALLGERTACYAQCHGEPSAAQKDEWRQAGFAGWARMPAPDAQLQD